jgi:hypothetical protein
MSCQPTERLTVFDPNSWVRFPDGDEMRETEKGYRDGKTNTQYSIVIVMDDMMFIDFCNLHLFIPMVGLKVDRYFAPCRSYI